MLYELAHREQRHRHRARPASSASTRLPEPHPARLRAARPDRPRAAPSRRAAEPPGPDRERAGGLRAARRALAAGDRRAARPALRPGSRAACVEAMRTIEELLGRRARRRRAVRAAAAPAGRHGLGRPPPRRALRAGVRLGRALRGAGGRHRRRLRRAATTRSASAAGSPSGTATRRLASSSSSSSRAVAKLRLLLVEPRGARPRHRRAPGRRVRALRPRGRLPPVTLWTNSVPARRAPASTSEAGFRLVDEEPHHSFGHDLVGETWELTL